MKPFVQHTFANALEKGAAAGLFERGLDARGNQSLCLPDGVRLAMDQAVMCLRAANPGVGEDELRHRAALKVALAIVGRDDLQPAPIA